MEWTTEEIRKVVEGAPVVVFGKGEKNRPMCGFSSRAYQILESCGKPFEVINIFQEESIRPALVAFSDFPTTPQIFIGGELIGGSDIAQELHESGELQKKIDAVQVSE
jgi:monothiol glutaredoxin